MRKRHNVIKSNGDGALTGFGNGHGEAYGLGIRRQDHISAVQVSSQTDLPPDEIIAQFTAAIPKEDAPTTTSPSTGTLDGLSGCIIQRAAEPTYPIKEEPAVLFAIFPPPDKEDHDAQPKPIAIGSMRQPTAEEKEQGAKPAFELTIAEHASPEQRKALLEQFKNTIGADKNVLVEETATAIEALELIKIYGDKLSFAPDSLSKLSDADKDNLKSPEFLAHQINDNPKLLALATQLLSDPKIYGEQGPAPERKQQSKM